MFTLVKFHKKNIKGTVNCYFRFHNLQNDGHIKLRRLQLQLLTEFSYNNY